MPILSVDRSAFELQTWVHSILKHKSPRELQQLSQSQRPKDCYLIFANLETGKLKTFWTFIYV